MMQVLKVAPAVVQDWSQSSSWWRARWIQIPRALWPSAAETVGRVIICLQEGDRSVYLALSFSCGMLPAWHRQTRRLCPWRFSSVLQHPLTPLKVFVRNIILQGLMRRGDGTRPRNL
jgi:hypothetical protein